MKRTLALLLACTLLLGGLFGCGKKQEAAQAPAPTATAVPLSSVTEIYTSITGLDPEMTVLSGEGVEVPLALYCYYQIYNASLLEYRVYTYAETNPELKGIMGTDGYLNWDAPFGGYDTLREYLNRQTEDTVRQYMALEALARENGLTLTEEDRQALEQERQELVSSLGSEEAFEGYIAEMGLSRANYDRISAYGHWFDKLYALVSTPGNPLYAGPEELDDYGLFTDHIYLTKLELSGYNPLSDEAIAAKKAKAEALAQEIAAASDPAAAFAALAEANSEDPYRKDNPEGYTFAPGTMNAAYETAAKALRPGQVSGVVEGETGFYIILRKALTDKLKTDPEALANLQEDYLSDLVVARAVQMDVTAAPELKDLDAVEVYSAYVRLMNGQP